MAAVGGNNIVWYTYRGEEGEVIHREATHIIVGEDVTVILREAFKDHPNIVEVFCHEKVEKIKPFAFYGCPRLRRVIMPGVKIVEDIAFYCCNALTDVECGNAEMIGQVAFFYCTSLKSINLPSVRIVGIEAFDDCPALTDVKFGNKLERFERGAFCNCTSLERITIPLRDGIITDVCIFQGCKNLKHVDLVEGEIHEIIASLNLEDWRNDINREIKSINQILPNADAGYFEYRDEDDYDDDVGDKAWEIRSWIRSVLRKIIHYQAEHQRVSNAAATTLQLALPQDIVLKNVLPFLDLPPHTFEVGDDEDYSDDSDDEQMDASV